MRSNDTTFSSVLAFKRAKKTKVFQHFLGMNNEVIASTSINDKGAGYVFKDLSRNSRMGVEAKIGDVGSPLPLC